jgi:D-inositol-3-phosphate glycosyltransferase
MKAARQHLGVDTNDWMILFVGRIEPLKGVDTLIRAMALLAHECPTWVSRLSLAIIGGDPSTNENAEMERLKAMHAELRLGDLVVFLGAKDQNKLQYYYNAAEALVMPSHYESFGMVALEAMACGTPVIVSDAASLPEVVGDAGVSIGPRDPIGWAQALQRVWSDQPYRAELRERGLHQSKKFTWLATARQTAATYRHIT